MELHGRNDTLTCLGGHAQTDHGTAADYDHLFLEGTEVPCPSCVGICEGVFHRNNAAQLTCSISGTRAIVE
jgi:hypothetical protein